MEDFRSYIVSFISGIVRGALSNVGFEAGVSGEFKKEAKLELKINI